MAPSAQSYQRSHATLEALNKTLGKRENKGVEFTLPERPEGTADPTPYLDCALDMLGASTKYLCEEMDKRFNEVDKRFNEVDKRFNEVDKRFNEVDKRFNELDEKVEMLSQDLAGIKRLFINRFAENASDNIVAVERNGEVPPELPHRVFMLWELQRPKNHRTFVRLLRFYNIDWKTWGQEDHTDDSGSDSDSDDIAQSYTSLEAAVKAHPEIALRALTDELGMNYDRISKRMSKWNEDQERRKEEKRIEKRKRITSKGLGRNTADTAPHKHRKTDAERTSPEELSTRLPLRDLVGGHESIERKSSPESGTKIGWNVGSSEGSQRRVRDTGNFKAASPSKAASLGSTVPFSNDEMDVKVNAEPDGSN